MFLSSVFPLGEKSGVNLKGNFNVGKGTAFDIDVEEKEVVKAKKEGEDVEMGKEEGAIQEPG